MLSGDNTHNEEHAFKMKNLWITSSYTNKKTLIWNKLNCSFENRHGKEKVQEKNEYTVDR